MTELSKESAIDELIRTLESFKAQRLKKSCSRDALNQANAFEIAIQLAKKIRKKHVESDES